MLEFEILNWGGRLTRNKQLIAALQNMSVVADFGYFRSQCWIKQKIFKRNIPARLQYWVYSNWVE